MYLNTFKSFIDAPDPICEKCNTKILDFYSHQKFCKPMQQDEDSDIELLKDSIKQEETIEEVDEPVNGALFSCPICELLFTTEAKFQIHYRSHIIHPTEVFSNQDVEIVEEDLIMEEEYLDPQEEERVIEPEQISEKNWEYWIEDTVTKKSTEKVHPRKKNLVSNDQSSSKRTFINTAPLPNTTKKPKTCIDSIAPIFDKKLPVQEKIISNEIMRTEPPKPLDFVVFPKKTSYKKSTRKSITVGKNNLEEQIEGVKQFGFLEADIKNEILEWMISCSRLGFPRSSMDVNGAVGEMSKQIPTESWWREFIEESGNLKPLQIKNIPLKNVTQLKRFHNLLKYFLNDLNLLHIFDDPRRIYNVDSVMFELNPEEINKAQSNSYNKLLQSNVLFTTCADGNFLPPLITLPEGETSTHSTEISPDGFFFSLNEYGIITNNTLIHYIQHLFYPALVKNKIEFPVILLIDGQKLNLNWNIFEMCKKLKIILISLYPNFNTVILPVDLAISQKVKKKWKEYLTRNLNGIKKLTLKNFPSTLKDFGAKYFNPENIQHGFHITGIYPFSEDSILIKPLLSCSSKSTCIHRRKNVYVHKDDIEAFQEVYGIEC